MTFDIVNRDFPDSNLNVKVLVRNESKPMYLYNFPLALMEKPKKS